MDEIYGLTPLENVQFLALFKSLIFWSKNDCFLSKISENDLFWHNFCKKKRSEKFEFLDKIHGLTPFENVHFLALFKTSIFLLKVILFFPQYQKRSIRILFLWKTLIWKSSIFGQNPWTNPFKKCPFFGLC